jgi:hypothetical protein
MIQVDTLSHKIPNFVEKAKRAGVTRVFIGLENINPDNLAAAKKRQNKITEYRKMLLAWKGQGILTLAGYILAGCIPGSMVALLHADAYEDASAPCRGDRERRPDLPRWPAPDRGPAA